MGHDAGPVRDLLVLGASGDLAGRLLLPGLGRLLASGRAQHLELVGAGVEPWDDERWRNRLREAFAVAPSIEVPPWERVPPAPQEPGDAALRRLERESVYLPADVRSEERRVGKECRYGGVPTQDISERRSHHGEGVGLL